MELIRWLHKGKDNQHRNEKYKSQEDVYMCEIEKWTSKMKPQGTERYFWQ